MKKKVYRVLVEGGTPKKGVFPSDEPCIATVTTVASSREEARCIALSYFDKVVFRPTIIEELVFETIKFRVSMFVETTRELLGKWLCRYSRG